MIDWVRVALITAGAFVGGELGLRFAIEQGRMIVFQPRWSSRALNLLTGFGVVMFLEAARVALQTSTKQHIWLLIGVSVFCIAVCAIYHSLELHYARREIKRLKSSL